MICRQTFAFLDAKYQSEACIKILTIFQGKQHTIVACTLTNSFLPHSSHRKYRSRRIECSVPFGNTYCCSTLLSLLPKRKASPRPFDILTQSQELVVGNQLAHPVFQEGDSLCTWRGNILLELVLDEHRWAGGNVGNVFLRRHQFGIASGVGARIFTRSNLNPYPRRLFNCSGNWLSALGLW